ncbi:MAG: TIGR00153 family protein [Deltaproteobacteria bacterium]|nr:TIGR00153 family protein [Deltaproteobacteria bacterium]MBW2075126.1 TIGR00153 family protein [Deltaproteobacteria bacterium]
MFLEKILSKGKKERKVIENIRRHIKLLCVACDSFKSALASDNRDLMRNVVELEREGDSIRREIISNIYEGAFLPYLRPDLCKFVEIVDHVFDLLEDTAFHYSDTQIPEQIKGECVRVALLNLRICEMLLITFEAMLNGEDLREKTLAIRIYEKKVDDIKFSLIKELREIPIDNFWNGKVLSDFMAGLTTISDIIEDASDYLQIISVSMR